MKKTSTKAFADLIGSVLFIALGIWAWIQTTTFKEVKGSYVQVATFPRIMIVGMLIFSVVLFIQSLIKLLSKNENIQLDEAESINFIKHKEVLGALAVIALCIFFTAFYKTLGYVICAAIVSVVIMYLVGKRNIVQIILVSILVPLFMWLIFYKVLTVNIPMGPLNFLRDLVDKI